MKTHFSGIGGLVAMAAAVVGFGAGCDGMELGDEAEGVEETSSELTTLPAKGTFTLHNLQTGYCLGVAAGNPNPLTKLVVWDCDGTANQNWQVASPGSYSTQIKNMIGTNRCLDMVRQPYVSYPNGTPADIDYCDKANANYWRVTPAGTDFWGHQCYTFQGSYINNQPLIMGVSGGSTARGAAVIMWQTFNNPNTHPDQYWCVY